jgi:pyruvate-ferredoxin/flavodoxin oxidoreductase
MTLSNEPNATSGNQVEIADNKPPFPGTRVMTDGNNIISRVAYKVNGGISIYTITPSSPFGEESAKRAALGEKNIYGVIPQVFMACDEAAAASFVQGMAAKGIGSATCSSSQGILLMIPEMYNSAGQLLPITFYIGARDLSRHSLTIFAGHSDVYAVRDTGIAIVFAADAQELQDIGAICERLKWETSLPVAVVYDGFHTTHRQTQVQELEEEFFWKYMPHGKMVSHKERSLDPTHPSVWGTNENPDGYMQAGLAQKPHALAVNDVLPKLMDEFGELTGRTYSPYEYSGHPEATDVIVAAGSSVTTLRSTIRHILREDPDRRIGVINVRAFRPFLIADFINSLPESIERIAVLDRSMTHTAQDEPLCADVRAAVAKASQGFDDLPKLKKLPIVTGGIYGVAGKDFHPGSVVEVFNHLEEIRKSGKPWTGFTVGVIDDVMGTSLPAAESPDIFSGDNIRQGRIVAYGSDGTVSMIKSAAEIWASQPNPEQENMGLHVASTADYDSRKAGGVTVSHFRVSTQPLDECFSVRTPDYVAVHHPALLHKQHGILKGIKENGVLIINTSATEEDVFETLTKTQQKTVVEKKLEIWIVDAFRIAEECGLGNKISMIMQRVLFEKFGLIDSDAADEAMETGIRKAFGRKGEHIVESNVTAFRQAINSLTQGIVPENFKAAEESRVESEAVVIPIRRSETHVPAPDPEGFKNQIQGPGMAGRGDEVSVGAYYNYARGGSRPTNTWQGLTRSFATKLPIFEPLKCNECGDCAFMCPTGGALVQAVLTPQQQAAMDELQLGKVFRNTNSISMDATAGFMNLERIQPDEAYGIAVDPNLCTGCGVCEAVCPKDAINLSTIAPGMFQRLEERKQIVDRTRLIGSDLDLSIDFAARRHTTDEMESMPNYLGTSGACSGCYEPQYVSKFLQLYPYTIITNATGCSSIWGAQAYETPYGTDQTGYGASWVNPLFENNAAVGGGVSLGIEAEIDQTTVSKHFVLNAISERADLVDDATFNLLKRQLSGLSDESFNAGTTLEDRFERVSKIKDVQNTLTDTLRKIPESDIELHTHLRMLRSTVSSYLEKTTLIVGGDGWAFDIGLQMLVHVLQSDLNVVVMVLVTDVYSNTGGQMSKATPIGMDTPFAPGGKESMRYPLGLSVAYGGNAYVGQVNLAYPNHMITTYKRAFEYKGPSLLLCYVPCMTEQKFLDSQVPDQARRATTTRYWPLWNFDPETSKWDVAHNPESRREVAKFEGDFIEDFCKYEGRFRSQFDAEGNPSGLLLNQVEENMRIWKLLKQNAGMLDG